MGKKPLIISVSIADAVLHILLQGSGNPQ